MLTLRDSNIIDELGLKPAIAEALRTKQFRQLREEFASPSGLIKFVRYFWPILEPDTPFQSGWAIEAICTHLEAVSHGKVTRLLINISPGACKSLLCNVFWPLWEWSALSRSGLRYLSLSYASGLTERDNRKMRDLIRSAEFQQLYGHLFKLTKDGEELIANDKTGVKQAAGIRGQVTGNRADRIILDDPNSVKEAESEVVREETGRFFLEGIRNRLNNLTESAIIVVQQRVHEDDVSGIILSNELPYEHLCIPLLYEADRKCETSIGWADPRLIDGECFWPERYPPQAVAEAREVGEFVFAGQYQQRPEPRGGGIIKRDYWQPWAPGDGMYPVCDYIVASLDPAFTKKEENDPSGFSIWGTFTYKNHRAVMLIYSWRKRYELHGPEMPRWPGETNDDYRSRTKDTWGLVEAVADACQRFKVHRLLIENKASGHTVSQELLRLYAGNPWGVTLVDPKRLDKMARTIRVQPIFAAEQVFAPAIIDEEGEPIWRVWAGQLIDEMAVFPRGKYDDLTDSATQALWWLRENGYLTRREEAESERIELMKRIQEPTPLYPV